MSENEGYEDFEDFEEPEEVLSELSLSSDDDFGGDDAMSDEVLGQDERERLANMTELEREMEVALKEERLQQKRQRAQLLRKEKKREKEAKELTEGKATPSERKSQDAKRAALQELAAKKRRQTGKSTSKKTLDGDVEEEYDDDGDGYDEGEDGEDGDAGEDGGYDDGYGYDEDEVETDPEPASYQEAKMIQVRRHKMEDWFDKPFFKTTMDGVVVRLAVGNKQALPGELEGRGKISYVCAKVLGLVERAPGYYKYNHTSRSWKSPYPFGKGKTSLWLRVVRGGSEKFWPLAQVSNSSITEQEWFHYQQGEADSRAKGGRELTRGDVERAKKRLIDAEAYTYSEKDVAELLKNKKAVVKNVAVEKARLERERDAALQRGEEALASELDRDIQRLEEERAKRRKEDKMAQVNAKNARKNFEEGLAFREDGLDRGNDEMDPFRRRATRPMVYWKTKRGEDDADDAEDAGEDRNEVDHKNEDTSRDTALDVHDAIRRLATYVGGTEQAQKTKGCSSMYNPNSNVKRRMLSRKFHNRDHRGERVRVYHGLDEFARGR